MPQVAIVIGIDADAFVAQGMRGDIGRAQAGVIDVHDIFDGPAHQMMDQGRHLGHDARDFIGAKAMLPLQAQATINDTMGRPARRKWLVG